MDVADPPKSAATPSQYRLTWRSVRNLALVLTGLFLLTWLGWWTFRRSELRSLDRALALPASLGLPSTPEDLTAQLTTINVERRNNLIELLKSAPFKWDEDQWDAKGDRESYRLGEVPTEELLRKRMVYMSSLIDLSETWRASILVELRGGAAFPTSLPSQMTPKQLEKYHRSDSPNFIYFSQSDQLKDLSRIWRWQMLLGNGDAWMSLSLLAHKIDPPGGYLDFLRYLAHITQRSRSALEAVIIATPGWTDQDASALAPWLEEGLSLRQYLGLSMTAERIFTLNKYAELQRDYSKLVEVLENISSCGGEHEFRDTLFFTRDFSRAFSAHVKVEQQFMTNSVSLSPAAISDILPIGCNSNLALFFNEYDHGIERLIRPHALKLAARICLLERQTGAIPKTQSELIAVLGADILVTEADYPSLCYEWASADRFRVFADPQAPSTWLFPRGFPRSTYHESHEITPIAFHGNTLVVNIAPARDLILRNVALLKEALTQDPILPPMLDVP